MRTNAQAIPRTKDDPQANFHTYEVAELRNVLLDGGFEVMRISRPNAGLGLAEIPRELAARRRHGDVYHGILAAPRTRSLAWRLKRRWLRLEGLGWPGASGFRLDEPSPYWPVPRGTGRYREEIAMTSSADSNSSTASLPPELALAFAPLHKAAFGMAIGTALALLLFVVTGYTVLRHLNHIGLRLLAEYLRGYSISWTGGLIGSAWAAVVGFVFGWFTDFCLNFVLAISLFVIRTRAERAQPATSRSHPNPMGPSID